MIEEQKRYYNGLTRGKGQGTQTGRGKTRPLIQPKYLYFLLPLTYECICFVATTNYLLCKDVRMVVKVLFIALVTSIIVFFIPHVILPLYSSSPGILQTDFWFIYLYLVSTVISLYVIREQKERFNSYGGRYGIVIVGDPNAGLCPLRGSNLDWFMPFKFSLLMGYPVPDELSRLSPCPIVYREWDKK